MNQYEQDNRKRLIKTIDSIHKSPKIEGWQCLGIYAVGGLLAVGFSKRKDILLVESSTGRGLFDCNTGEKIARDYNEEYVNPYDYELYCMGIDVLSDEEINTAGINGGGLLTVSPQGDSINIVSLNWPIQEIIFCPNYSSIYDDKTKDKCCIVASEYEIRACGFSSNGNFFILATSSDFVLYKRIKF